MKGLKNKCLHNTHCTSPIFRESVLDSVILFLCSLVKYLKVHLKEPSRFWSLCLKISPGCVEIVTDQYRLKEQSSEIPRLCACSMCGCVRGSQWSELRWVAGSFVLLWCSVTLEKVVLRGRWIRTSRGYHRSGDVIAGRQVEGVSSRSEPSWDAAHFWMSNHFQPHHHHHHQQQQGEGRSPSPPPGWCFASWGNCGATWSAFSSGSCWSAPWPFTMRWLVQRDRRVVSVHFPCEDTAHVHRVEVCLVTC